MSDVVNSHRGQRGLSAVPARRTVGRSAPLNHRIADSILLTVLAVAVLALTASVDAG
jgi:hypothetical protein